VIRTAATNVAYRRVLEVDDVSPCRVDGQVASLEITNVTDSTEVESMYLPQVGAIRQMIGFRAPPREVKSPGGSDRIVTGSDGGTLRSDRFTVVSEY